MDVYVLVSAVAAAGAAMGGAVGYFARPKTSPPPIETHEHLDVPMIEIDGQHVPHPTIVARRARQQRNSAP